jgi:hypothetical protein
MTTDGRDGRLEGRMREARLYFERHHANAAPDAGFVARVASRLTNDPAVALGWAAMRLLPASLLLVAILGYVSLRMIGASQTAPAAGNDDDVIAWVLASDEAGR